MSSDRYELIDFGDGRKLESLAGHLIDRPCPAAANTRRHDPKPWNDADARYDLDTKSWTHHRPWPASLEIDCGTFRMPVRATPFGHIGLFPEQADNWRWLGERCSNRAHSERTQPLSVSDRHGPNQQSTDQLLALNLFGYAGASSIAMLMAGYHVAHVDAAKPNVDAARIAADLNGQSDAPIRFLVDDAAKFVAREVRRQRQYRTIVLDPPAYGHSPRGKAWRLQRDLWPLLEDCLRLLDPTSFRLLITGHSRDVDQADVTEFLRGTRFLRIADESSGLLLDSGRSQLKDKSGRCLDAGFYIRAESRRD